MAVNPACQTFIPQLSPFIDGELSPSERTHVERHIAACRDCAMRSADLRAESGLVRIGMEMLADEVDFKDFSQKVMARLTPVRPPLLERIQLSLGEMFTYQRGMMVTSMATAAVIIAVAVPLVLRGAAKPAGYARQRLEVQTVSIDSAARFAPVVMETDSGDAIIWMVDDPAPAPNDDGGDDEADEEELHREPAADPTKLRQDAPTGGEL